MARSLWPVTLVMVLSTAAVVQGTETRRWIVDSAEDFLAGRGDGVAVMSEGRLAPVAPWDSAVSFDEPVVLAVDSAADGSLIVGTGHPARLYRVQGKKSELLTDIPGEQITAILAEADGGVVVATMAPGALYRWRDGELDELGRLGEGGFWDLTVFDGRVVAAAGPPATLYRVGTEGLERWLEVPDTFVRCLDIGDQKLLLGTSGKGLILSVDSRGRLGLVADSPFTEISDLVYAPDGSVWATALVGEPPPKPKAEKSKSGETTTTNGTTETSTVNLDLPKVNGGTATSEVVRLTPEGAMLKVHRFTKQVASAMALDGDGVLVGTGYEGELWRFVNHGGARLASVDAVQVVAISKDGSALLTQGPASLLRRGDQVERARFRSHTLKLKQPAVFGEFQVLPSREGTRIRFRSGVSEEPDPTWLPWSEWVYAAAAVVPLPAARSLQWEVELPSEVDEDVAVERVEVAYREVNLSPEVQPLVVEEPGVIYLAAPPPTGPVIDVGHPDVNGIFSVVGDGSAQKNHKTTKGKKYWRVGMRTVAWKAADPNKDAVLFALELEREDGFRLPVRDELKTTQLAVDTTAVPDGRYRFHLTASDHISNPGGGLQTTVTSRWIVVDNTPPVLSTDRRGASWRISVEDASSPIARVEWSRDGEKWSALAPKDGILDGRVESFDLAAEAGRHLLVVRAIDDHHNRSTIGVAEE